MDIRFYDFEFHLLHILPDFSNDRGVISMNTTTEFNGSGSFELVFRDMELKQIIADNRDHLIVCWNGFQGYATGYQWAAGNDRVFGEHLNGLLKRRVIPKTAGALKGTVKTLANNAVETHFDWLSVKEGSSSGTEIEFWKNTYHPGNEWIEDLLDKDGAGYRITADFALGKYWFEVLKSENNPLILSENNLNAYDFQESYDNKDLATGGWFEEKTEETKEDGTTETVHVWKRTALNANADGIYRRDVVLSTDNETEAKNMLKAKKTFYSVTSKTRNIQFGTDYRIGDILRVQNGMETVYKKITAVNQWQEQEYGEEPVLEEV